MLKAAHFILAALFLYVAFLQVNDPDPLYWIAVYAGTALIALAKGLGRFSDFWAAIALGLVIAGLLFSAPGFADYLESGNFGAIFGDMGGRKYVESAREFLGQIAASGSILRFVETVPTANEIFIQTVQEKMKHA